MRFAESAIQFQGLTAAAFALGKASLAVITSRILPVTQ